MRWQARYKKSFFLGSGAVRVRYKFAFLPKHIHAQGTWVWFEFYFEKCRFVNPCDDSSIFNIFGRWVPLKNSSGYPIRSLTYKP